MSNDTLMLLFTAGIFLISLLTFSLCESSIEQNQ
ncbi:MAG: putative holin-like toxin [Clostridium chrysemydis]